MDSLTGQPRPVSRRWRLTGWLLAAVWLFFLNVPFSTALQQPQSWRRIVGVVTLVAFGLGYVLLFQWARNLRQHLLPIPVHRARLALLLLLGLGLASIPGTAGDWTATLVFVAASAVFLLPAVQALVIVALCALTPLVAAWLVPAWTGRARSPSPCCSPRSPCSGCPGWRSATVNSRPPSRRSAGWRSPRNGPAPPATCTTFSGTR
ncbi:hypothetical protein GCM10027614_29940 [Micromonospora vulcania]